MRNFQWQSLHAVEGIERGTCTGDIKETKKTKKKTKGNQMKEISTKNKNWKENHTNQRKAKRCLLYHLHSSCLASAKINALKIFL